MGLVVILIIIGLIWLYIKVPKIALINTISIVTFIICFISINTWLSELFADSHAIKPSQYLLEENIISEQEYKEEEIKANGKLGLGIEKTEVMFVISVILGLIDIILVITYILKNDIGKLNVIISIAITSSIIILESSIWLYIYQCA